MVVQQDNWNSDEISKECSPEPLSSGSFDGAGEALPPIGKVSTWMLVGLTYYAVSGGPLGLEVAVAAGGPALALLGFLVVPLVWACSEAALTTELSIAYPEASGYCAWLNAAFGPYASFICSMLHYVSGVLDNAIYPVLFVSYMSANESLAGVLAEGGPAREATIISFSFAITYLTWRGLDVNGSACVILTVSVCLPFLVFAAIGLPSVDPANFFLGPSRPAADENLLLDKSVQWGPLLNCLFWNLNVSLELKINAC